MKILMLADPQNIHTKRWVSSLSNNGIAIFLFGFNNYDKSYYVSMNNVTVEILDCVSSIKSTVKNGTFDRIKYLKVLPYLKKIVKEFQPDVIHAHYASSYGLLGVLTHFHPLIISAWGSDIYCFPKVSFIHKNILKYNLKKADYLLSTSHVMANEMHLYTKKDIKITPFGVDTGLFKKLNVSYNKDSFVIGCVKKLELNYGIDTLIQSFKILVDTNKNKDLTLVIIGEGVDKGLFEKIAIKLGIRDKVSFLGKIENQKLPEYYNSFSVSVYPSISESFGVASVEAMSCECPVITSDADGFTEIVEDGITGFIVPKKSPENIAKYVQKLIDDEQLRIKMGEEGRKRVLKLYNWNDNVQTMMAFYKSIIL